MSRGEFQLRMGLTLGHFNYVRRDSMLCGILRVKDMPAVSTFWRYLRSMGIVQSFSILRLNGALRQKAWELCEYHPRQITVDLDTTVSTVYGEIEGARKGHNTKHRGKKGLRPVLCFVAETREYLCGTQRRGQTITNKEVVRQIKQFPKLLPDYIEKVRVHGDGEFIGWESVKTCIKQGIRTLSATGDVHLGGLKISGIGTRNTNTTNVIISL